MRKTCPPQPSPLLFADFKTVPSFLAQQSLKLDLFIFFGNVFVTRQKPRYFASLLKKENKKKNNKK